MKERNKKVASGMTVFLLIWWEQFSYSVEMQQALILASPSTGATCYSHALSCVPLCH
jgi:hypothetical protein